MNNYYNKLALPVQVFNKSIDYEKYCDKRFYNFELSNFSQEYVEWVKSLGLNFYRADMLYSEPNHEYSIHKDIFSIDDFAKINFVYGGKDTQMNWYKVNREKIHTPNIVETYTELYTKDQVDLAHSTQLQDANLVQAGVAHNVVSGNEPRWCISTVYVLNKKFLTWPDAIELFKPFMIK